MVTYRQKPSQIMGTPEMDNHEGNVLNHYIF